ncbi:substrate-binding domain-containing protein [Brenneria goodwinii]|uniref:Putative ABC transporter, periplasmic sugar binding protein n=1 Tax=Brenneria goodwinii TaxID=1109412 RepID=A0A0G4JXT7_9GAMM|nr:substrate-binding domain-containing protein [Brenneria goodwinii]CPR18458.1 Putative ABC transporter, periplasmic sugar binding protein precursor [Brenneria goodwinii]
MKKSILPCLITTLIASSSVWAADSAIAQKANKPFTLGVVVKVGGIPWFNVMEQGIKEEGKALGVDAWQVGPTTADPAEQVRAIEDLIAKKVDVIGVVPNDAKVLEPVLKRAQQAGIKVITHESPAQTNADWDFELLDTQNMGANHMKDMAACMGEKGKYAMFVGSLTVPLVNEWADAAIAYQKAHYPDMTLVEDRFGVAESVDDSMRTANDLLSRHKDLKGIMSFGSQGPIGAARAIDKRKKNDATCVFGTFTPGQGIRLLEKGAIDGGYISNPMVAGKVFVQVATAMMNGEALKDGVRIGDMGEIKINGNTLISDNPEKLDVENTRRLVKLGL